MHPSERAAAYRELVSTELVEDEIHGQPITRLVPTIQPSTIEEADALQAIDAHRQEERYPATRKARARRARAHWGDRDHALGR